MGKRRYDPRVRRCFLTEEIFMATYQIFNPQTGLHTRCMSEDEAKTLTVEIAKQVLALQIVSANLETVHENGDVTWEPVDFVSQLVVTI